ncbi:MAG: hypothetical protein ABJA67_06475, partial [Chthonomonadales bacterium]
ARKPTFGTIAVAERGQSNRFIVQTILPKPVKIPNHLIVVLDGSQDVKSDLADIKEGLAALPSNVTSSLIVASDSTPRLQELQSLSSGLPKLSQGDFDGGQDNLQAVVKAASTAGETKDGAVLWIHGPQPTLNKELYVMAPYTQTPSFYELSLDNSVTDGNEFFKNHREIGPFAAVPRNGSIKHDLRRFVSKWQPNGHEYVVKLEEQKAIPEKATVGTAQQASELSSLNAKEQSQSLIARGDYRHATAIAVKHQLVTPVSSAVVLGHDQNNDGYMSQSGTPARSDAFQATAAPELAGATNATTSSEATSLMIAQGSVGMGVQPNDPTFVTGVNTAGTVRVNNLANLESLLNIIANFCELSGIFFGGTLIVQAFLFKGAAGKWFGMKGVPTAWMVATGMIIIIGGLAVPGTINWLLASARDANLFS